MKFSSVAIQSLAHHLPDSVLRSEEIEAQVADVMRLLRIPPGRLQQMTGIEERRFWENGTPPSKGAVAAGTLALDRSGIPREEIGCLVYTSVCRDHLEPATSTIVHERLGLPDHSSCFDISNACLGFMNGLVTIANQIELGQIRAGVVVASENSGPVLQHTLRTLREDERPSRKKFKKIFPTLTLGSGAVAAVLCHRDMAEGGHRLMGGATRSATRYNDACRATPDHSFADECHPFMETDAITVMDRGCELARDTWQQTRRVLGWENHELDRVICHQIGLSHRDMLFEKLGLDVSLDFPVVQRLGNMGSVGVPMCLSLASEAGALHPGNRVALLGIGSGLNSLMLGVEW